jgi:hypothetical protein
MPTTTTQNLIQEAQKAGYRVVSTEQLRSNRWLLHLLDSEGADTLVMVQARPLVGAADVQDLAELVRLRRSRYGILLSSGSFSAAAQRTAAELGTHRLRLCSTLPPAGRVETIEGHSVGAPLKSSL